MSSTDNINCDDVCKCIPSRKYNLLAWNKEEEIYLARPKFRRTILTEIPVPFSAGLQVKLRRSIYGTFLKCFNVAQLQDYDINDNKLGIADNIIKHFNQGEIKKFEINNNITNKSYELLKKYIDKLKVIGYSDLLENFTKVRLTDYNINMIDDGVNQFKHLQELLLAGNWIEDLTGSALPRKLKYLELYGNRLTDVKGLTNNPPKSLKYLGLGHNPLTNESSLHLLARHETFPQLLGLDLSECDIYYLIEVLEDLQELQQLEILQLAGNPCAMVMPYKDMVVATFPDLSMLDGAEITTQDKTVHDNSMLFADEATIVISCSKLFNLPKPKKKKIIQTIHVEFKMPLLQDISVLEHFTPKEIETERTTATLDTLKSSLSPKKTPKKRKKIKSPYKKPADKLPKKLLCFQTAMKPWKKKMKFPALTLYSPERNLFAIRDCFKSNVVVEVIYLERKKPPKKPKGGKKKKDKKDKKKKEKKRDHTKAEVKEKPKEIIKKRIPIGKFLCELREPVWNEKSLELIWSENPKIGNTALEPTDFKKALKPPKEEKKGNKSKDKTKKKKKEKSKKKQKEPPYLTCHVNFSLQRL